ncbi:MAG: hypothetical protein ACJ8MH_01570 [Povalibacter sp.]
MTYSDGKESEIGDAVLIDGQYRGLVVACIDSGTALPGNEDWGYLKVGIMVNTDFGGLVHYANIAHEDIRLVQRAQT